MKKPFALIAALFVAVASLSMYGAPCWNLLDNDDYRKEQDDSTTFTITAPDPDGLISWRSFNQWRCFAADQVQIECDPDGEAQDTCYPHLIVEQESSVLDFQLLTPSNHLNSSQILDRWQSLLVDEDSFCTYAAYLPDISEPQESIFSIDRLKTTRGHWDYDDEENWREPDEGTDQI